MEDPIYLVFILVIAVLIFAGMWKAFVKAGEPGWGCLIPIYNLYLVLKIAGKPDWWIILYLIPLVNLIVALIVYAEIANRFGKSTGFGIGLVLLGFIFWPILGYGDAQYMGGSYANLQKDISSFGTQQKDINTELEEGKL